MHRARRFGGSWRRAVPMVIIALIVATACDPRTYVVDPHYGDAGFVQLDLSFQGVSRGAFAVLVGGAVVMAPQTNAGVSSIERVKPDGTIDTAFAAKAPALSSVVSAIAVDTDGRIVTAEPTGVTIIVRRLLPDGRPDSSFGSDGKVVLPFGNYSGVELRLDHAGNVVVLFTQPTATAPGDTCAVTRLKPDGTTDETFAGGLPVAVTMQYAVSSGAECRALLVRADDSLLVVDADAGIAAIDSRGSVVGPYGSGAQAFISQAGEIVDASQMPGGRVVLGASMYTPAHGIRLAVARLNSTGDLDPTFGTAGIDQVGFGDLEPDCVTGFENNDTLSWLSATPDGRLLAVGATCRGLAIARWSGSQLDKNFNNGGRLLVRGTLFPSPRTGGIGADGTIYTLLDQSGSPYLSLMHLAGSN